MNKNSNVLFSSRLRITALFQELIFSCIIIAVVLGGIQDTGNVMRLSLILLGSLAVLILFISKIDLPALRSAIG